MLAHEHVEDVLVNAFYALGLRALSRLDGGTSAAEGNALTAGSGASVDDELRAEAS